MLWIGEWEYFEERLNPTDTSSSEEVGPEDSEIGSLISRAEVTEVVKKLLCIDESQSSFRPWML